MVLHSTQQLRRFKIGYIMLTRSILQINHVNIYVDGPTSAAEIWVQDGADTAITATTKTASEWKTIMVMALGRGRGTTTLWSSSSSCDSSKCCRTFSLYGQQHIPIIAVFTLLMFSIRMTIP
jgi:hypothetical protein